MTNSGDEAQPQRESLLKTVINGDYSFALQGLSGAIGLPVVGALGCVVIVIVRGVPILLIGIPLFAVAFGLALWGWTRSLRVEQDLKVADGRGERIDLHRRNLKFTGIIALSLVVTFAGIAVPIWAMNSMNQP